jgi:transposase InsO family protein
LKYFDVKSSTYYDSLKSSERPKNLKDKQMKDEITELFFEYECRLGYRAMTNVYNAKFKVKYNRKRISRLMRELSLKSKVKVQKRKKPEQRDEISDNHLNRDFKADKPNSKWSTDTTQMNINGMRVYLCIVIDLYSREIIGYSTGKRENTRFVIKALNMALGQSGGSKNIIVHSDRGSVYTSAKYHKLITSNYNQPSNSRPGNCWDNAMAENFFSIFKSELIHLKKFTSVKHLIKEIENYVTYYNTKRIQNNTKLTPEQIRNNYYQNQNILNINLNLN